MIFRPGFRSVQRVGFNEQRQRAGADTSSDTAAEISALTSRVTALEVALAALTARVVLLEPQLIFQVVETDTAQLIERG